MTADDRSLLAAELAVGLLDGADLADARALAAADPDFAAKVAGWSGRLAPMLDGIDPVEPPAHLIDTIRAAIGEKTGPVAASRDNVVQLRRRLNAWRGMAAGATAIAASLAVVLLTRPPEIQRVPVAAEPARPSEPMVAALGAEDSDARLVATWDRNSGSLMVAAATGMDGDAGRAHELWVIPADGTPRSLGVMPANAPMRARLPSALALQMAEGATLAVSVEPAGGSPTGLPTGPVIASGKLQRA